jgi:hypothetical protein
VNYRIEIDEEEREWAKISPMMGERTPGFVWAKPISYTDLHSQILLH